MKNLIAFIAMSTLSTGTVFAQQNKSDNKEYKEAKAEVLTTSKVEWKAAMNQYEADMNKNKATTLEVEFLKYKTTLFDQRIKDKEARMAPYQATLKNPLEKNEAILATAQENIDRLNKDIEDLKAQKADAITIADQAEKDAVGTYKSVEQIRSELDATQAVITARMEPYRYSASISQELGDIFLHQDIKYEERKTQIADDANFNARRALDKKYPPSGMFRSEVTNFYTYRSNNAAAQNNVAGNKSKKSSTIANNNANTATTVLSNDPATDLKMAEFNKRQEALKTTAVTPTGIQTAKVDTVSAPVTTTVTAPVTTTVAVPATMTDPVTEAAPVVAKNSCEDDALKEIYKILNSDKNNTFAKMYELTVMKLAKKTLDSKNKTLEGYTKNKITEIEGQINASKASTETQARLIAAYESYGEKADLAKISAELDATLANGKKANYGSKNDRLWNSDVSSYVLAASIGDPNSGLKESDAAVIWAVEKIRVGAGPTYDKFTEKGNLMNTSTRVARYLGAGGAVSETSKTLDAKIAAQDKVINDLIKGAYASVKSSLSACLIEANSNCADCANNQQAKFENEGLGLDKIQRGLASAVTKGENQKMEGYLKGKIGDVTFDFNKTLAKVTVPTTSSAGAGATIPANSKLGKVIRGVPYDEKESNLVAICLDNSQHVCSGATKGTNYCCDKDQNIKGSSNYVIGTNSSDQNSESTRKIVKIPMKSCVYPNGPSQSDPNVCLDPQGRIVYQESK